jgi:hypothetical protein
MKLVIEIPEEFVEHFNNDRFEDSLMRVEVDIENRESMLSGLYEIELIAMLRNALNNAVEE